MDTGTASMTAAPIIEFAYGMPSASDGGKTDERALVIAHPRWYPRLADSTRTALIRFARAMAGSAAFDRARISSILRPVA